MPKVRRNSVLFTLSFWEMHSVSLVNELGKPSEKWILLSHVELEHRQTQYYLMSQSIRPKIRLVPNALHVDKVATSFHQKLARPTKETAVMPITRKTKPIPPLPCLILFRRATRLFVSWWQQQQPRCRYIRFHKNRSRRDWPCGIGPCRRAGISL